MFKSYTSTITLLFIILTTILITLYFEKLTINLSYSLTSEKNLTKSEKDNIKEKLVLYGGTMIDGVNPVPLNNVSIVITDGKIREILNGNNSQFNLKQHIKNIPNMTAIDITGKYIIPGLFDMHAHVAGVLKNSFNQTQAVNTLTDLLNHGITTIRNPGGPTKQSIDLRENISAGEIYGPQILTAGQLLNSANMEIPFVEMKVNTNEEIRNEVRIQANLGVDYIKLYVGLPPDLVEAAIDEAHNNDIGVIGHLYSTSWTDSANMGIDYLTHGIPVDTSLLSSQDKRVFQENIGGPFDHFLWLNLVDLNSKEINDMVEALARNNVSVDSTLSIYEAMLRDHPDKQYLWPKILQLTKKMYDKGVNIIAGTDIPNFDLIPGSSLHHELQLISEAGISNQEVIRIATRNAAESLGLDNETGTIEIDKQADMVILSSNPIEDIRKIQDIHLVVNDGKIIDDE